MPSMSPELELVVRLARLRPTPVDDARARELASTPLDWARVRQLANHHGLVALIDRNLARLAIASIPQKFLAELRRDRMSTASADLARYDCWLSLCEAFDAWGIPAITLKGFHVVHAIYGEVGLRPVGDLDFLVGRDQVAAAIAHLEARGFVLTHEWAAAIRNVGLPHILDGANELMLVSAQGIMVDLHWEATRGTTIPSRELFRDAVRMPVHDRDPLVEPLVEPLEIAMVLLILHGHRSAWERLRWLVDVVEGLALMSVEQRAQMERRLDALGQRAARTEVSALIQALWGETPWVDQAAKANGPSSRVLRSLMQLLEQERRDARVPGGVWRPLGLVRHRLAISDRLLAAVGFALLPTHRDWAAVALPESLRLGYYLVRPWRVLSEAWRGRRPGVVPAAPISKPADGADGPVGSPLEVESTAEPLETVPLTFVTAIYDSGPDSMLGGRGWGIRFYLPSLINIAKLGASMVVYCPAKDAAQIEASIAPWCHQLRVIPYELSRFEYYDEFMAWKRAHRDQLEATNRNEVLCFLKSYWLLETAEANPFGHQHFLWIDAGLTHHGIFPERIGGVELLVTQPTTHYYPSNPANIFTPALGRALVQWVRPGRVSFCAMPFLRRDHAPEYARVTAETFDRPVGSLYIADHLVGGLFGGHVEDIRAMHEPYRRLLHAFIRAGRRTLEEQVFSSLQVVHPELFALQRFTTWHFHSPGEPNSFRETEGDSFHLIFTDLLARAARASMRPAGAADARITDRAKDRTRIRVFLPTASETDWFPNFTRRFCAEFLEPTFDVEYAPPIGEHEGLNYLVYDIDGRRCTVHPWTVVFQGESSRRLRILSTEDHPLELFELWGFDPECVDRIFAGQYNPVRLHNQLTGYLESTRSHLDPTAMRQRWRPWLYRPLEWKLVETIRREPAPKRLDDLWFRGLLKRERTALTHLRAAAGPGDRVDLGTGGDETTRLDPSAYLRELRRHSMALSLPGAGDLCHRDIECFALGIPVLRPVLSAQLRHPLEAGVHYVGVPFEPLGENPDQLPVDAPKRPEELAHDLLTTWRTVRGDADLLRAIAGRAGDYYDRFCAYPAIGSWTLDLLELDSL